MRYRDSLTLSFSVYGFFLSSRIFGASRFLFYLPVTGVLRVDLGLATFGTLHLMSRSFLPPGFQLWGVYVSASCSATLGTTVSESTFA